MKDALNSYIDLYTEIDSATEAQPFDWSTYADRIAQIKQQKLSSIGDNYETSPGELKLF